MFDLPPFQICHFIISFSRNICQPQRLTSADGKSDAFDDPMEGLGYVNIFIMCRARFSSISLCRGTGCFLAVLGFK